jgi:hypothetical protein
MHQMFRARDATLSDAAARNDELTSRLGHDIAALRSAIGDGRSEAEAARVDVVQLVGGTRARLEAEAEAHAARGNEQLAAALAEVRREVAAAVESVRADGGALRTALETRWVRRALHRQAAKAVLANALDAMPCHTVRAMCGWASFASRPNTPRLARCYRAVMLLLARHIRGCDVHARGGDSLQRPDRPVARYALRSVPPMDVGGVAAGWLASQMCGGRGREQAVDGSLRQSPHR